MEATRIRLAEGVHLTYLPARKFKTSLLSAQFVTPLRRETAGANALLAAVLRRGTVSCPDMGALSAKMTFGETIGHMIEAEVEWYSANLIFGMTTHYFADLSHHQAKWTDYTQREIAQTFSEEGVVAAIRAIQKREITYREFLQRIADAGVVYYTVHLLGRKAIYFGRHGDFYIEPLS